MRRQGAYQAVVAADDKQAGKMARRQQRGLRECRYAFGIRCEPRDAGTT